MHKHMSLAQGTILVTAEDLDCFLQKFLTMTTSSISNRIVLKDNLEKSHGNALLYVDTQVLHIVYSTLFMKPIIIYIFHNSCID